MLALFFLILSPIEVCEIVGSRIDSLEAKKYHLFTDIDGFKSARFFESSDSIIVRLEYLINNTMHDSTVTIDPELVKSLGSYIHNFRMIIEDESFRLSFIETFTIGWPIISQADINRIVKSSTHKDVKTASCCMAGACALGAYSAALLTRDIRTEVDTITLAAPCFIGSNGGSCIFIPVPVERKIYSFDPAAYIVGATVGSGLGYVWAKHQFRSKHVLSMAIAHDIVAFDDRDFPITGQDITTAYTGTNEMLLGTLGLGAGLLGAGATAFGLLAPWADKHPEQQWHAGAIDAAVVVICGVELVIITNFFINKGRQLDRQATIERLRRRHTEE